MGMFARKSETLAEAPAKRSRSVTGAELSEAIGAVHDVMYHDCSAWKTLERLWYSFDRKDEGVVSFDASVPSLADFDAALDDVQALELPAGTLRHLKIARELLVKAVDEAAKVGSEPVTRAEFDAMVDANALAFVIIDEMFRSPNDSRVGPLSARLAIAAQSVEFESTAEGIRALLKRREAASKAESARQMRRESDRNNGGPGGPFHFPASRR